MKKSILLFALCVGASLLFSQGYYIEFKITSSAKSAEVSGSMKLFSQDGNSRSEIVMKTPQAPDGEEIKFTSLSLKDEPQKVYLLNEKDKTYSELNSGSANDYTDYPQSSYEVIVIGKEIVNSYNTTHVSIKINGTQQEEMWTTKDIVGYADFSKLRSKYTGKDNLYKALAAKGADGMPVRIKVNEHGQSMQIDLLKAEKRNNAASLFSLSGYTTRERFSGVPGTEGMQQMIEKLQNMTPQEREEMVKKLQQQYGSRQPK